MSDITAWAQVKVTIEVDVGSAWGTDCSVGQVHKQGGEEAVNKLRNLLQNEKGVRIIGFPEISAIIAKRK